MVALHHHHHRSAAAAITALLLILSLLLTDVIHAAAAANNSELILDGVGTTTTSSSGLWQTNSWRSQVDGVMGGQSSGELSFLETNTIMKFSGVISLEGGGGFSSVIKSFPSSIDLKPYAGIVVELETTTIAQHTEELYAPLGLHLQFHDSKTRYIGYASAFAVPLSNTVGEVVSVYLPLSSFDRGSWIGQPCTTCEIDFTSVVEMDIYVLFQEGPFEVRVKKIAAVEEKEEDEDGNDQTTSFPSPSITLSSTDDIKALIDETTESGGGLYDKGYQELCIAIYRSVLNTILEANKDDDDASSSTTTTGIVSERMRNVICQGLQRADTQKSSSKVDVAWTMRYTLAALLEEMGFNATSDESVWRPDPTVNEYQCSGVTSGAHIVQKVVVVSSEPTNSPPTKTTATPTTSLSPSLVALTPTSAFLTNTPTISPMAAAATDGPIRPSTLSPMKNTESTLAPTTPRSTESTSQSTDFTLATTTPQPSSTPSLAASTPSVTDVSETSNGDTNIDDKSEVSSFASAKTTQAKRQPLRQTFILFLMH